MKAVAPGVEALEQLERNTEGANRIKHPQKVNWYLPRVGPSELLGCGRVGVQTCLGGAVMLERRLDEVRFSLLEQAAVANHAGQAAHRISTAAEPEKEQLVAGSVVVNQKTVSVADVLVEAGAEGAAHHPVGAMLGAHPPVIEDDLMDALGITGPYGAGQLEDVGGAEKFLRFIPGAIGTDDQASRHEQFSSGMSYPETRERQLYKKFLEPPRKPRSALPLADRSKKSVQE